jgi:hypothetical protein
MKTKKHMKNEANYMDIASNNSSVKKDPSRGIRYKTDEDKRNGFLEAQCRYNSKKWHCEHCDKSYSISNRVQHQKTKKHMKNEGNYIS